MAPLARRLVRRAGKDGEDGVHAPTLELLNGEDILEQHIVALRRVGLEVGKGRERRLGQDWDEDARAKQAIGKALLPRLPVLEALLVPPRADAALDELVIERFDEGGVGGDAVREEDWDLTFAAASKDITEDDSEADRDDNGQPTMGCSLEV